MFRSTSAYLGGDNFVREKRYYTGIKGSEGHLKKRSFYKGTKLAVEGGERGKSSKDGVRKF